MEEILNFLLLHYKGNRRDTDFWKDHRRNFNRTSSYLKERLEIWQEGGFVDERSKLQIYSLESYYSVVNGLDLLNREKLKRRLLSKRSDAIDTFRETHKQLQNRINWIVEKSMTMDEWYKRTYGEL
jgi:hypothetical protein